MQHVEHMGAERITGDQCAGSALQSKWTSRACRSTRSGAVDITVLTDGAGPCARLRVFMQTEVTVTTSNM